MPGVAGLRTVLQNHSGVNLSNPQASFGVLDGNPIWEEMRDLALAGSRMRRFWGQNSGPVMISRRP